MSLLLRNRSPLLRLVQGWSRPSSVLFTRHSTTTFQRKTTIYPTNSLRVASAPTLPTDLDLNATSSKPFSSSSSDVGTGILHQTVESIPENHNEETVMSTKSSSTAWDHENWRKHPDLNPTLTFPTWAIPLENARSIQALLSSKLTQPFLATRHEILQQVHPKPKIVQQDNNRSKTHKLILLNTNINNSINSRGSLPPDVAALLEEHQVEEGPDMTISIQYHQLSVSYILERLMPPEVHPVPTTFETVGHVAHLNLRQEHVPYAKLIGQVLLECLPTIETVIQKVGQVSGPYRTYDYELLAGRNDTTVKLTEHGVRLEFDLSKVYWCTRLAQERQVILDQEIQQGQIVADAFSGVGAICLRAALTKNCTILANDWNPNAVEYLKNNFVLNKLEKYLKRASCQDAYDFLMDLGLKKTSDEEEDGDHNNPVTIDHVLMNFPLKAPSFLGALRWWPESLCTGKYPPRLHVYTFARADPDTDRSAEDVAVDLIASELLPLMGRGAEYENSNHCRKTELNEEYGCNVVVREVRDVAPGKIVFCVSFTATSKLLRHMQGNYF